MTALAYGYVTPEQYLLQEDLAEFRSEYWNGKIVAMSGGTPKHNQIGRNLALRLGIQLDRSPCKLFLTETRVRVPECNTYFYPDAMIVCGTPEYEAGEAEMVRNPTVIFEVLSPGTEAVDRGRKFACYRSLPSLQLYVLIQQDAPAIELYARQPDDTWLLTPLTGLEATLFLNTVGVTLPFTEIYQDVVFPPPLTISPVEQTPND